MKYTKRYLASLKANPPPFKKPSQDDSTQPEPSPPLKTPGTVPSITAESQIKACAQDTGRWFKTALNRSASEKREFNSQTKSLLFTRLPPELRDLIWEFALSPTYLPYEAVPAHFHVYKDAVFDSCTYESVRKRDQNPHLMQISLLLTCRAIHNEALRFLYKDQDFTIALCAGLARPRKNIKQRRSLGRPSDCATLVRRMRSITLVVQPGEKPYIPSYTAHITAFLATLDNFQHTKATTLHFNFGTHASHTSVRLPLIAAFHALGQFYTLNPSLPLPAFTIHAKRVDPTISLDDLDAYCDALSALCTALSPPPSSSKEPPCDLGSYTLNPPTGNKETDFPFPNWYPNRHLQENRHTDAHCLRRGAWGEYDMYLIRHNIAGRGWQSNLPPPPMWGRVLLFAALPLTGPFVIAPAMLWVGVDGVVRAVRKGEL